MAPRSRGVSAFGRLRATGSMASKFWSALLNACRSSDQYQSSSTPKKAEQL
jgi:hypothetical protein